MNAKVPKAAEQTMIQDANRTWMQGLCQAMSSLMPTSLIRIRL